MAATSPTELLGERWNALRQAWDQRAPREQRLLAAGGAAVIITLFYLLVWEPIGNAHLEARRALEDARATAQRIETVAAMRPSGSRRVPTGTGGSRSLLSEVDRAARSSTLGKAPERLTPEGDDAVRVWLDKVQFANLLRWLAEIERGGSLRLESADIERDGAGQASARMQIERAS
ncbi:type II secretion system protein M [Algiphilus sp.]|uniref:type II secretion system protein M n=1 Tax=Algiphilus sp. TaxID=1872431 RepID=UPI0025BB2DBA|nr:type II secretion system protein M [Algiphilus sp.]MCK5770813.1 type II secretion system protein M [Algiphilus sp.]